MTVAAHCKKNEHRTRYHDNTSSFLQHTTLALQETLAKPQNSQQLGRKADLINTNSLQQHIIDPTRRNDILDLVMTTHDLRIIGLEVMDKIGDHHVIDFALQVHDPNNKTQLKASLNYERANSALMKEELSSFDYEVLMRNKNAEECFMILEEKIATATQHHIPTKRIRLTNNPHWFSHEIKLLINARQQSYKKLERYQTEPYRQEHICTCRVAQQTIRSINRNKEIAVSARTKTNPKSFHKYVYDRRLE
ncbi:hypothetical protein FHG87_018187 [Trinorchestia longiramus]|nr:hypothetical protein FHG87_018187 [Trinorchestia longiramus]